jgi:MFS family permease
LGYFVDVYDIWVFGATRVPSLKEMGLQGTQLMDAGILLLNLQMVGMLIGGMLFGILGDKFGRTRVMFISIFTYSVATFANAFVPNVEMYAVARFFSGLGLSGELGLGATLVAETLSKEKRGFGIGLLVGFGVTGAIAAGLAGQHFHWRTCYIIGGVMGFLLLLFRMRVLESHMFKSLHHETPRGDIRLLFKTRERASRFFWCLTLGLPTWFSFGIFLTFSEEILKELHLPIIATAVLLVYCNIGLPIGDVISMWISQVIKSRRKVFVGFIFIAISAIMALYFLPRPLDEWEVKLIYGVLSIGVGAWVMMTVISAEVFGTNLRATVATSVPNFARGSVVLLTGALSFLKGHMPLLDAVLIVGVFAFGLPLLALWRLPETFSRDLNYLEE